MNRREFLSKSGATTAALSAGGVLAVTPADATEIGPIEKLLIEYQRRHYFLADRPGDDWATDEEADWAEEPLEDAIKLQPAGEREWASFIVLTHDTGAVHWDAAEAMFAAAEAFLQHPEPMVGS